MKRIIVVGTGGVAREFTAFFGDEVEIVGYSSTNHLEHGQFGLPGVLHKGLVTPEVVGTDLAVVAIGTPHAKARIFEVFKAAGFQFPSIIHPSSIVCKSAKLEEGVIVSPHCVVSPNVALGTLAYINFACGIGHDSILGRFVQINPGSQLGGYSRIGDATLIGSGSTILQGISVGSRVTVGSGR